MEQLYNEKTIGHLGALLAPGCPKEYREIFAMQLVGYIVPWVKREQEHDGQALIQMVENAVENSFKPYNGSTSGAASEKEARLLLYSVLWGRLAGRSLMNDDFKYQEKVSCWYDKETKRFKLSLLPDGQAVAYSRRQLGWCMAHVPQAYKGKPWPDIVAAMFPAWEAFGNFNTSLPREPELTGEEAAYIERLFMQAA